jgi:two-component sensor histidine kinase
VHPDDRAKMLAAAAASIDPKGGGLLDIEYRVGERWVHTRAQVVQNGEGVRMVGTVRDVSESKDAEARQALVRSELQHRIKNTLAMVNAIASQTLRGDDIADRRATFNNRLAALAGAHDMLMVTDVRGGDLRSIVERALAPHASHDDRFVIAGPDVALSAKQSLSMALVVHELATNAAKYGALSTSEGGVSITWGHEAGNQPGEPTFNFVWEESGGPRVVEPTRKGFGSRLINRVLSGDFNGTVSIEYAPGGVRCVLQSPPSSVALGASGRMEPAGN